MAVTAIDPRARQILFDAYWSAKGWHSAFGGEDRPRAPAADFAYAKANGTMFDPLTIAHDQLVTNLRKAFAALTLEQVRDAFLASLSTRRCDLRSGLASYTLASTLRQHKFKPDVNGVWCQTCGGVKQETNADVSVLNFERHKWGGVRHEQPLYQLVDLTALRAALPAKPEAEDRRILSAIFDAITRTPKTEGPTKLSKRLKDVLPSSAPERNQLLEILAIAGILVPRAERSSPGEWSHAGMWRGADGYDKRAVAIWFGKARKTRSLSSSAGK